MQTSNVIRVWATQPRRAAWTGLLVVFLAAAGCGRHEGKATGTAPANAADNSPPGQGDLLFVGNDWGSEIWIFDTESGAASKALFCVDTEGVNGLNFDDQGNLFESDFGTHSIVKFTPEGKRSTYASLDSSGGSSAFDAKGNLIIPFQWGHKIEKISSDGSQRSALGHDLGDPIAVAFDQTGQAFVADQKKGVVYKFTADGTQSLFASGLNHPGGGIAFDQDGNLFVGGNSIYKIAPNGSLSVFAKNVGASTVAFDSHGNLFMTTGGGGSIYKFSNKSGRLSKQRKLFASGLGHDYFMAISPRHLPYVTVKLPPGSMISGVVVDPSGQPVAGAKVRLNNYRFDQTKRIYIPETSADTDRDGHWSIEGLPENYQDFGVTVSHPDFPQAQFFADGAHNRGLQGAHISTADFYAGKAVLKLTSGCKLSGAVRDEAGKPVAGAALFVGFDRYMSGAIKSKADAQGNFNLKNLGTGENYLTVSAQGFAPQFITVSVTASNAPLAVVLKPGQVVRGRVVDAAGKPLADAEVSYDGLANRNGMSSGRTIEWKTKTDMDGEFAWDSAPAEPVRLTITKSGYMALEWQTVQTDTTNAATFTLGSPLTVKGSVTDTDSGEPLAKFTITPGWPEGGGDGARLEKQRSSAGKDGHYEVHFDSPIIISPTPYDFVFQISAPGYAPAQSRAIKPGEGVVVWDVKLKKTPATIASVKTADGKPAAGVKVFLAGQRDYLQLDGTELSNQNRDADSFETDADGHFELPPQAGEFNLVAASPAGFALVAQADFTNSLTLTLQPWGRVEGALLRNGRPLPDRELYFFIGDGSEQRNVWMKTPAPVDAAGKFVFPNVPAGTIRIELKQPMAEHSWSYTELQSMEVKPGGTNVVQVTLNGRDVAGHWKKDAGLPPEVNVEQGNIYLRPDMAAPPVPEGLDSPEKVQKWYQDWMKTEAGKKFMAAQRKSGQLQMKADGTLRGESIAPGKYTLSGNFWGQAGTVAEVDSREVAIPESTTNDADAPFDLGEILVKAVKHLNIGEVAPDFSVKTLDGQPLKLSDFRGKYVLLDFWATWCGPCVGETPHMKAAYDAYGGNTNFVMVSLSLDQSAGLPKKFAQSHDIQWLQGFLGDWNKDTVTKDYCVRGIPSIFLIGPDGKIIAQNLRGEAIKNAVGSALGTK
jgi:thiol-disulfide isomerase/thioredoxin/protocatechuate 3,4-dioxygenase beta subunit